LDSDRRFLAALVGSKRQTGVDDLHYDLFWDSFHNIVDLFANEEERHELVSEYDYKLSPHTRQLPGWYVMWYVASTAEAPQPHTNGADQHTRRSDHRARRVQVCR
jgi:hypothetical protein